MPAFASTAHPTRELAAALIAFGVIGAGGATLLGLFAPWVPVLDITNHFRPFLLAGALVLLAAAAVVDGRRVRAAGALLAANLVLMLPVLLDDAPRADGAIGPTLRVASFNLLYGRARPSDTAAFLREANADVVLLQEASDAGPLVAALSPIYPHVGPCPDNRCEVRLLAKRPFVAAGHVPRSDDHPPLTWARFAHDGREYEIAGVHLAPPMTPRTQARHVDGLIGTLNARPAPVVIAGDFNLTPFSWGLAKLALATGLRRHLTWAASWPAYEWTPPFVLIDNVLASPALARVAARPGPRLGSDHLPVVADLALRSRP